MNQQRMEATEEKAEISEEKVLHDGEFVLQFIQITRNALSATVHLLRINPFVAAFCPGTLCLAVKLHGSLAALLLIF